VNWQCPACPVSSTTFAGISAHTSAIGNGTRTMLPDGPEVSLVKSEGLQCTETAILAVPFRYSLADALAA
jgi:hypothetical protein